MSIFQLNCILHVTDNTGMIHFHESNEASDSSLVIVRSNKKIDHSDHVWHAGTELILTGL